MRGAACGDPAAGEILGMASAHCRNYFPSRDGPLVWASPVLSAGARSPPLGDCADSGLSDRGILFLAMWAVGCLLLLFEAPV